MTFKVLNKLFCLFIFFLILSCDEVLDIEPPEVEIISPNANSSVTGEIEVKVIANDNIEMDRVELEFEGQGYETVYNEPSENYTKVIDFSGLEEGDYSLIATAYDKMGNWKIDDITIYATSAQSDLTHGSGCENWQDAIVVGLSSGDFTEDALSSPFPEGNYFINSVIKNVGTDDAVFFASEKIWNIYLDNVYFSGYTWTDGGIITSSSCVWGYSSTPTYLSSGSHELKIIIDPNNFINESNENNNVYNRTIEVSSTPTITLTSPNGGENWQPGSSHAITWTSQNLSSSYVRIKLYRSGSNVGTIISSTYDDDSHTWSIPSNQTESSYYQVRIEEYNNSSVYDGSDNYFTIVLSGSNCTEPCIEDCDGECGPSTWVGDGYCDEDTYYNSTCGYYPNFNCSLFNYDGGDCSGDDGSGDGGSALQIISPNGGEYWNNGGSHTVQWQTGSSDAQVHLEIWKGGSKYQDIYYYLDNSGSYSWYISPSYPSGSDYRVKVIGWQSGSSDLSNSYFTIQ